MTERRVIRIYPRVLPPENPIEAIREYAGASEWEEAQELAEQERLDSEYERERAEQAEFYAQKPVITESRRRLFRRQIRAGQMRLPDIFRGPVPKHVVQYGMFSDLELHQIRDRLIKAPVAEGTSRTTPTGYPLYRNESMQDIIEGSDFRH